MPRSAPPLPFKKAVGARLRQFVEALGISEAEICRKYKIGQGKFSQWESGRNLPDIVVMVLLKNKHGLSLDWLYAADTAGLRGDMIQKIEAAEVPQIAVRKRHRRPRLVVIKHL